MIGKYKTIQTVFYSTRLTQLGLHLHRTVATIRATNTARVNFRQTITMRGAVGVHSHSPYPTTAARCDNKKLYSPPIGRDG